MLGEATTTREPTANSPRWARSIEEVLQEYGSRADGLSSAEAGTRLARFGANRSAIIGTSMR
jgi:hypothetical protein